MTLESASTMFKSSLIDAGPFLSTFFFAFCCQRFGELFFVDFAKAVLLLFLQDESNTGAFNSLPLVSFTAAGEFIELQRYSETESVLCLETSNAVTLQTSISTSPCLLGLLLFMSKVAAYYLSSTASNPSAFQLCLLIDTFWSMRAVEK